MSERKAQFDGIAAGSSATGWLAKIGAVLQGSRLALPIGSLAVAALIVAGIVWILHQERLSDEAVAHTFRNEKQLARVMSTLQDAELGQRGFLLTGDRFYLEPYDRALTGIEGELDRLADGLSDNAAQAANVAVLRSLVAQKLSELRQTVDRRRGGDAAGALLVLQNGQGKLLMDGVRDVVARMEAEEERLMVLRTGAAGRSVLRIEIAMLALLLLSMGLAVAAVGSTLRRARSAEASRDELLARFDRRLMAVMAADVTGFSSMMESDEAGTLTRLMALRERCDPIIGRHGGRVTGTAGDSMLAVFPSALSAVDCAVEMQQPGADGISLRIGVNVGDVITQDGDVFGDTVNIAARLESLARPGGICVSRAVRDHVGKQRHLTFHELGLQKVKNIAEPVAALEIGL